MFTKDIFVVEGPAGGGKTTLIRGTSLWHEVHPFLKFERPRAYEAKEGVALSMAKDLLALYTAVEIDRGTTPPVLDRCLLSQWVYGSIRRGVTPGIITGTAIVKSARSLLEAAVMDVQAREGTVRPEKPTRISLHFVVLIPSVSLLIENRFAAGREFPYDPFLEVETYERATALLKTIHVPDLPMTVSTFSVGGRAQYPELGRQIGELIPNMVHQSFSGVKR